MAAGTIRIKPLKGAKAKKFTTTFESSAIKKDSVKKAIDAMKKGFDLK